MSRDGPYPSSGEQLATDHSWHFNFRATGWRILCVARFTQSGHTIILNVCMMIIKSTDLNAKNRFMLSGRLLFDGKTVESKYIQTTLNKYVIEA
jgi:hypothetical protein